MLSDQRTTIAKGADTTPSRHLDRTDVALVVAMLLGCLMLGGWGLLPHPKAQSLATAGGILLPLSILVGLVRYRRRMMRKHGLRLSGVLNWLGYLSYWAVCGTLAFVTLQLPRLQVHVSPVGLSAEDSERLSAAQEAALASMVRGLVVLAVFLPLMIVNVLYLRSLERKPPSLNTTQV